jgi:hypothetical protein
MFVDPAHDDFRLAADSPARKLGFEAIDAALAGPRGPRATDDLAPVPTIWLR